VRSVLSICTKQLTWIRADALVAYNVSKFLKVQFDGGV
jgi:hypothetical protein